jgi:hypothetical protein
MNGLRRFILWDYPRAGWQYDIIVAGILAFIFLVPREIFRDQPKASNIVMLPSEHTSAAAGVFWIDSELLLSVPETSRAEKAAVLLKTKIGRKPVVSRLEPIFDSEQEIKGFMAYTTR